VKSTSFEELLHAKNGLLHYEKISNITGRLVQQLVSLFACWKHQMMMAYHMG
jgi:hypothetical protein